MDKNFIDSVYQICKKFVYSNINLSLPAKVVNVDNYNSKQTIDVAPLVNSFDEDNEDIELPVIYDVIVCLQEAGGALISLPVKVGDKVRLDFSKEGLDAYLSGDGTSSSTPLDKRKFSLTDCFATLGCPTISTNLKPNAMDLEIKFAGSSWKMKPNGNVQLDVAGDYIENISGNKISNVGGSIQENTPSILHNNVEVGESHYHTQGNDSNGDSQADTDEVFR